MATKQILLTIERVLDDSTGIYRVGEIDFGIYSGLVDDYLELYGVEGRDEIINMLGYLIHNTFARYEKIAERDIQGGCQKASK